MKKAIALTCVFVDVRGVLLTDGWDHHARKRAARSFKLNWAEMEERHLLMFETYEEGKLTLRHLSCSTAIGVRGSLSSFHAAVKMGERTIARLR